MAYSVTVNGNTFSALSGTVNWTDVNGVPVELEMTLVYETGPVPQRPQEVVVTVDGTVRFTGVILEAIRRVQVGAKRVLYEILAEDYYRNFRRDHLAKTWRNVTLKSVLTDIAAKAPGVTLHPAQDDGPTWDNVRSNYLELNELTAAAGKVAGRSFHVDEQKRLRMFEPGSLAAPAVLRSGPDSIAIGEIDLDVDETEYLNRVTVVGDPLVSSVVTETHTGGIPFVDRGDFDTTTQDVIYAVDTGPNPDRMYEIQTNGAVRTIMLTGTNLPNAQAWGVINGRIYVSVDRGGGNPDYFYEVQTNGTVTRLPGTGPVILVPQVFGVIGNRLYVYDDNYNPGRLWSMTTAGVWSFVNTTQRPIGIDFGGVIGDSIYAVSTRTNPDTMYRIRTDGTVTAIPLTGTNLTPGREVLGVIGDRIYYLVRQRNPDTMYEIQTNGTVRAIQLSGINIRAFTVARAVINGRFYLVNQNPSPDTLVSITTEGAVSEVNLSITTLPTPEFWGVVPDVPIRREYFRLFTENNVHQVTALTREGTPESIAADDSGQWKIVPGAPYVLRIKDDVSLGNTDDLSLSYTYLIPVIATAEDEAGRLANGLYGHAFPGGGITQQEADEQAMVLLQRHKVIRQHLRFTTKVLGWRTGQRLVADLTDPNLTVAGNFTVDGVEHIDLGGQEIRAVVSASNTVGDEAWTSVFEDREKAAGRILSTQPVFAADGSLL